MRLRLAGLLVAICALAAGCGAGSSKLLDGTQAAGLKDNLEQVRSAVDARDCSAAAARLLELRSGVGNLPGTVDRQLRVRLREEIVGKLAPAVKEQCDDSKTEATPTVTEPAPTAPVEPSTPEPAPTTSTTTPPTETTPPPTDTSTTPPVPGAPDPVVPDPAPVNPDGDGNGTGGAGAG